MNCFIIKSFSGKITLSFQCDLNFFNVTCFKFHTLLLNEFLKFKDVDCEKSCNGFFEIIACVNGL